MNFTALMLRHGSCMKNSPAVYGGSGGALSPQGVDEIHEAGSQIRALGVCWHSIRCAPRMQCEESGSQLALQLGVPCATDGTLEPIFLGVIDGLTEEEVELRYPKTAKEMRRWRNGLANISEVRIPRAEPASSFLQRGRRIVAEIEQRRENVILVGTRSIIVLLANIFASNDGDKLGGYREIVWPPAGILVFHHPNDRFTLNAPASTVCLK